MPLSPDFPLQNLVNLWICFFEVLAQELPLVRRWLPFQAEGSLPCFGLLFGKNSVVGRKKAF
jgi:hypothetical protein